MKLSELYDKRKALSGEIETLMNGEPTGTTFTRANALSQELEGMDEMIRRQALRDERDAGGIVPTSVTGKASTDIQREFRVWMAGGFRSNARHEFRAVEKSELGGATTVASNEFIAMMNRDAVIAGLATEITVDSGAPVRFYRQTAHITMATTATAEAAAFTSRDLTAEAVDFTPVKIGVSTVVSNEALRDLPYDVASDTIREHAEAHAANWEFGFANASYSGLSQAIFDQSAGVGNVLSYDTAASSNGFVTVAEATQIVYGTQLKVGYLKDSVWLLPSHIWAGTLSQTTTNPLAFGAGYAQSMARDGMPLAQAVYIGFPVYISTALPTGTSTAATKFGVFGSVKAGYRVVTVNSVPMLVDPYTNSASGQTVFNSETRRAGKILDRNAMITLIS